MYAFIAVSQHKKGRGWILLSFYKFAGASGSRIQSVKNPNIFNKLKLCSYLRIGLGPYICKFVDVDLACSEPLEGCFCIPVIVL